MPKYYMSHPEFDVVIDAIDKRTACEQVCETYKPDINRCEFIFVNEQGFSSQFCTESAVDIKEFIG